MLQLCAIQNYLLFAICYSKIKALSYVLSKNPVRALQLDTIFLLKNFRLRKMSMKYVSLSRGVLWEIFDRE